MKVWYKWFTKRILLLMLFGIGNWIHYSAFAQPYYPQQQYQPGQSSPDTQFGTLYNPIPILIHNAATYYHGPQDVWATAYLPFIESEYDASKTAIPFSPGYTTAIALTSAKNDALGLYAPIEVIASVSSPNPNLMYNYPFASVAPNNINQATYNGPFNTLKDLNQNDPGFNNPLATEYGISVLEAVQKFTQFTYDFFSQSGIDKQGNKVIIANVNDSPNQLTGFDSEKGALYFNVTALPGFPHIERSTVGHELTHAILNLGSLGSLDYLEGTEIASLNESFADIIGLSFENWVDPNKKFDNPNWVISKLSGPFPANKAYRPFDNPKLRQSPTTYKGEFWKESNEPGYRPHNNGMVMSHWFYLLNVSKSGYIDDNPARGSYVTEPLIPGNKEVTYTLALKIVFNAMTEKLAYLDGFSEMREKTLEAAVELGNPVGSEVYNRIMTAWYAVGIGPKPFASNPDCAVMKLAESKFNGQVYFKATEATLTPDPLSAKAALLADCSTPNGTQTADYNPKYPESPTVFMNLNPGQSQIYGPDNDTEKSKSAVSVHKFSILARDWYKSQLGYDIADGQPTLQVMNVLGNPQYNTPNFKEALGSATFYYPYKPQSARRDQISLNYFNGVDHFVKAGQTQSHTVEWETILTGVAEIFSLDIKQDYEQENQNPNAGNIWTLNEDMSDPAWTIDFAHPKLYGRPAVYQGVNWKLGGINSGIINLWYYLLVHGTKDINGPNTPDDGYQNDEPGSKIYHVIKIDKDLVLKMVWEAYKSLPVNSSLEEFRLATHSALKLALGSNFDPKGKENIALNDAWAAVLGLPDYASTLKHFPADGETVYPWAAKVGVEVEYPKFESERLFEVSKSATFNSSEAPVYRFLNNVAPELATGMTYGLVNLEPGQIYYVRSRLSLSGNLHDGCSVTPDPDLCMSLNGKLKWTLAYEFKTEEIPAVTGLNPKTGQKIPAWASPMSWTSMKGAGGYNLYVIDNDGTVPDQDIPHEAAYNEDETTVSTQLALSRTKKYSWTVAAHHKLGSEWACHVSSTGATTPFSQEEKDAMPNATGKWADIQDFQTDKPTIVPGNYPAQGQHIPLIGPQFFLTAKPVAGADRYMFQYNTPVFDDETLDMLMPSNFFRVSSVPGIADLQTINWAYTPQKKPTPPFITTLEDGETVWRKFVVDNSLSPKPNLVAFPCAPQTGFTLEWEKVDVAKGYKYTIKEAGTNLEVVSEITDQLKSSLITTASKYPDPGNYVWGVSAGVKKTNGDWLFGPEVTSTYGVRPNAPTSITPTNDNIITLGDNNSVTFSWQSAPDPHLIDKHIFFLSQGSSNGFSPVPGFDKIEISGNQITVPNLEFDKEYGWWVNNFSNVSACGSLPLIGKFKSKAQPIIPEIGFTVSVDDHIIKKGIKVFLQGSCIYSVKVRRPDGQVMDFGEYFSNTSGITFTPGIASGLQGVGQIPEMAGDWEIELEITATNFEDYAATPTINLSVLEYFKDPASNNFVFNKIYPANGGGAFGGRVIHHKVVFGFNYQFPTN